MTLKLDQRTINNLDSLTLTWTLSKPALVPCMLKNH